jgi:DNA-binding MarR family transcriptional regulator
MSEKIYWREVLISLRRIIHATDLQSKQVVKACGLTIPQIMVLNAIDRLGDVTIKRISDDVSLSQATVTTILNRLEQRELVERVRNTDDKRIVNARLTAAGAGALQAAPPLLHENFIQRFEALGKREKAKILSSLQQVAKMMDADDIDAVPLHDIAPLAGLDGGVADPS